MGALIALPIAGMVGGVTWFRTTELSGEAVVTSILGAADLAVYPAKPDSVPTTEELRALLPAGSVVEPMTAADGLLVLPGRRERVFIRSTNLDGLGRGIWTLIEGRLPADIHEVAVSRSVASVAEVALGDEVTLEGYDSSTVVGLIENRIYLSDRIVLMDSSLADVPPAGGARTWLVGLPDGAGQPQLGELFEINMRSQYFGSGDPAPAMLAVGGLVLIETMLIAAAAFAVSIRRRQRELGLLAAAGASRRQLAGTVLAEGLVVGGVAVAIGSLIGVGLIALASPWLDQLTNHRNPPLVIDPLAIGLACSVGLIAALAAAAVPAWTAARLPPLVALSGRRPSPSSARRTLLLGLALIAISAALTATSAAMLLESRQEFAASILLAIGAILGMLGFGACSPWLVERLEWVGSRLPLAARIALRDTARARSRTAPIVTATLAGLAAALAISTAATSLSSIFNPGPWLRPDQLMIGGEDEVRLGPEVAAQLPIVAAAQVTQPGLLSIGDSARSLEAWIGEAGDAPVLDPEIPCADCLGGGLSVGSPDLLAALGVPVDATAVPPNSVLLLVDKEFEARAATLAVSEYYEEETAPGDTRAVRRFAHLETLPARAVVVGASANFRFPTMFIAAGTASRLGFRPYEKEEGGSNGFLIRLARPVTEADVDLAASLLADSPYTFAEAALRPPVDNTALARLIVTVLSFLMALTITAIAVALGESEARADQRTLLAVGADPSLRRRIAAARAAVIALVAGVLAVPAGLLPVWGVLTSRDVAVALPLPELLVLLILLPLVAAAGALFLSRPIPVWSAFRDANA